MRAIACHFCSLSASTVSRLVVFTLYISLTFLLLCCFPAIHRNVAGPYAYPRLQPPRAFHFAQNNAEALAYYLNMSPPGLATPPNDHSPVHHISPLIGRQLNVSDNSAFVRFSPRLNSIHGQVSNGWPACEVIESKDAAFALASLQHKTTSRLRLK